MQVFSNQFLSKMTTLGIGGVADVLISVGSNHELLDALNFCNSRNLSYYILGNGSKILASDNGFRGAIIRLDRMKEVSFEKESVYSEAGSSLMELSRVSAGLGLSGLEFACGIPASLGGAIVMNAGCYGKSMSDIVVRVDCIRDGKEVSLENEECKFSYRQSIFRTNKDIIIGAALSLKPQELHIISALRQKYIGYRQTAQPKGRSAGSSFCKPEQISAGELIDKCGLKGYTIGKAQISTIHANFIINLGGASSTDVVKLLTTCEEQVFHQSGIKLKREIICL